MVRTMTEEERVVQAHGLTAAEWAVLFTASYHTPLPREQVLEMASLEVVGEDVPAALQRCLEREWLALWDRDDVVLTDLGLAIKDSVSEDLMATVLHSERSAA